MVDLVLRRLVGAAMTLMIGGLLSATMARYAPGFGVAERRLDARLSTESLAAVRNASAGERSIGFYSLRSASPCW